MTTHITVLGGGPAALAIGYYARKRTLPFTIYEAEDRIGGNSITLKYGDFLFDSGAHRFHDKNPEITEEIKTLLGSDLKKVTIPSKIYDNGVFLKFPLSSLDLLKNMGVLTFAEATIEVLRSRLAGKSEEKNFENFALHAYGNIIASRFLLNYSEKLWGASCNRLSPSIAGKRLEGLDLKSFIMDSLLGSKFGAKHMEGSFFYPEGGIGTISEKLADVCARRNIHTNSRITKVIHDRARICGVEINGAERIDTDVVASTLPVDFFLEIMEPKPPEDILRLSRGLRYRNVILVAFFLDRESITNAATVYFPDSSIPFTRVYEPKNRNRKMSPPGKTSLIVEIPCQGEDDVWNMEDDALVRLVQTRLVNDIRWIKEDEITGTSVNRLDHAYPILEVGFEEKLRGINVFLDGFNNLKLSGRNGKFVYSWIHNMMAFGRDIVEGYTSPGTG